MISDPASSPGSTSTTLPPIDGSDGEASPAPENDLYHALIALCQTRADTFIRSFNTRNPYEIDDKLQEVVVLDIYDLADIFQLLGTTGAQANINIPTVVVTSLLERFTRLTVAHTLLEAAHNRVVREWRKLQPRGGRAIAPTGPGESEAAV